MQESLNIGIDVAKAQLVIGVIEHPELNCVLPNTISSIKRWQRQHRGAAWPRPVPTPKAPQTGRSHLVGPEIRLRRHNG